MSENLAVNNINFKVEVTPVAPGSPIIATPNNGVHNPGFPAVFGIDRVAYTEDSKCKCQEDPVIVNRINERVPGIPVPPSGGTADDFSCGPLSVAGSWTNRGSYVVLATAIKTLCSGIKPLREGDQTTVNCICAGQNLSIPPQPFTGSCSIKISVAGQVKAKAE